MNDVVIDDRRLSPRRAGRQCEWVVSTRVRPGREVTLLDLSRGGALVEGTTRMTPGEAVDLHLLGLDRRHTVRGRVLRCAVSALDACYGVKYRAALCFDEAFVEPWVHDARPTSGLLLEGNSGRPHASGMRFPRLFNAGHTRE